MSSLEELAGTMAEIVRRSSLGLSVLSSSVVISLIIIGFISWGPMTPVIAPISFGNDSSPRFSQWRLAQRNLSHKCSAITCMAQSFDKFRCPAAIYEYVRGDYIGTSLIKKRLPP